jgi:hypothetical protein
MAECDINKAELLDTFDNETDAMDFVKEKRWEFFDDADDAPMTWASRYRFDRANATNSSKNSFVRKLGWLLFEDPVGAAKKGWVRPSSASLLKGIEHDRQRLIYNKAHSINFKGWVSEQKQSGRKITLGSFSGDARAEFNSLVSKAIRSDTPTGNKWVDAMADIQRNQYRELLEMMKNVGVRGAEDVETNYRYITRIWSRKKLDDLVAEIGEENVVRFLSKAMLSSSSKHIDETARFAVARHLMQVVRGSKVEQGINLNHVLTSMEKKDTFRTLLQDKTDLGLDKIDEIADDLFKVVREDGSSPSYLKHRIQLDEKYSDGKYNIEDLFENDAELLFLNYANSTTGRIALAQKGIKSDSEWRKLINQTRTNYRGKGVSDNKAEIEVQALEDGWKYLVGVPLENDPTGTLSTAARFIRKYNFSRLMNQVGFAQIAEFGVVMANIGVINTIKHVPAMRKMLKKMKDGTLDDPLLAEAELWFGGIGSQKTLQAITNQTDDFGSRMGNETIGKAERFLDVGNRATSIFSGMFLTNTIMQRITVKEILTKFAREANTGKKVFSKKVLGVELGTKDAERMLDLGISPRMRERIMQQFKEHAKYQKGEMGGKLHMANLDIWTDHEARAALVVAVRRFARRTVQENDIGETAYFGMLRGIGGTPDGTLGKTLFQFRSFMMTAWGKHAVHGMRIRDFQAFEGFMLSMFMAGNAYMLQSYAQSLVRSDSKKFLEERLSSEAIAKAAFQRAAFASIMPPLIDLGLSPFREDPLFHFRSSGLDTNIITGNPTYSLIFQKLLPAIQAPGKAAFNPDRSYNRTDWNNATSLLAWQNMLGIQQSLRLFGENFPEDR